jgi:hypothetical protein
VTSEENQRAIEQAADAAHRAASWQRRLSTLQLWLLLAPLVLLGLVCIGCVAAVVSD